MSKKKQKDPVEAAPEIALETSEEALAAAAPEEMPMTEGEEEDEGLSALDEAAGEGLEDDAFNEFKDYDSLDEETIGDAQLEALAGETDEDRAALISPKERRLSSMRLEARVEAVIFAAQKPLKTQEILDLLGDPTLTVDDVQVTLDHLVDFYEFRSGGFRLHYLKRLGYQFQTADAAGPIMERMFASRPRPISRAALETLAIIAYRQPVTRAEVEFIRGVDAGSIFKTLLERDLIKCVGRKEIVGRPMLFGTSDDFLKVFNLSSVKDLPPLESFQPSRDMVQGALEKIEGSGALVDVEEYIADNTRGEYDGDDELLLEGDEAADGTEAADTILTSMEESAEAAQVESEIAATIAELESDEEFAATTTDGSDERLVEGATAQPPAGAPEEGYGENSDSEMALPAGDGVPPGSGDLDQ